jgi:CheY-like chemotaxis protein
VTPDDKSNGLTRDGFQADLSNLLLVNDRPTIAIPMSLTALIVSPDAKAVQILKRILMDLGLRVEDCSDLASAGTHVTKNLDAIVIDCKEEKDAVAWIESIREARGSSGVLIVALVDGQTNVREVFAKGANFTLYKPVSEARAASSLRAARALMKRERRQRKRVAVHTKATMAYAAADNIPATVLDLSETGLALQSERKLPPSCKVYFQFNLPGQTSLVRLSGEIVWQDSAGRVGIRFADVPQASRKVMNDWLQANAGKEQSSAFPAIQHKDVMQWSEGLGLLTASSADRRGRLRTPCRLSADVFRVGTSVPYRCTLSDISDNGCYVESTETFDAQTPVQLVVRTNDIKLYVQGTVLAAHPSYGMGVRFTLRNPKDRDNVQKLVQLVSQAQTSEDEIPTEPWVD